MAKFVLVLLAFAPLTAAAMPLAAPGDIRLRHDLQLLNDSGVINVPLTAWPISLGDIQNAMQIDDATKLSGPEREAFERVRDHLLWEIETGTIRYQAGLAAS